ncbi:putative ester cyclase [Deinococcus metalli]|uniref:Putative ester cyclase n=1 Tax=Deinococcus metalli TaxID=1141878 RepID=A0A7W8NTD7_9DEIO|nr:ester cyclase [Deinococcus metalli]MBB5378067.1 putative ester cyclase [Deinococcus metalli]GHF54173.1 hypothetical protein GCM10017781_33080 [Deinococcus metalli]
MSDQHLAQSLLERDMNAYADLLHDGYVNHTAYAAPGEAGSIAVFQRFPDAFQDLTVTVEAMYEDGETVIGRFRYRGTFTGPLMGHPPTGQAVEMHSIEIRRVCRGHLQEHWDALNTLDFSLHLGAASVVSTEVTA